MDLDDGIIHCALASGRVFDSIQKSKRKKTKSFARFTTYKYEKKVNNLGTDKNNLG